MPNRDGARSVWADAADVRGPTKAPTHDSHPYLAWTALIQAEPFWNGIHHQLVLVWEVPVVRARNNCFREMGYGLGSKYWVHRAEMSLRLTWGRTLGYGSFLKEQTGRHKLLKFAKVFCCSAPLQEQMSSDHMASMMPPSPPYGGSICDGARLHAMRISVLQKNQPPTGCCQYFKDTFWHIFL